MTERIRAFVAAHLDVPSDRLTDRVLLGEELAVDSLAAIELAMALEEEFGITLTEDVMAGVHTYGDLERAVLAQAPTA
ncbi:MAG: acyl carrier protein [Actinomycetota bacterium]|nr:acyl carrier protein [Actinomycetota bacterium]